MFLQHFVALFIIEILPRVLNMDCKWPKLAFCSEIPLFYSFEFYGRFTLQVSETVTWLKTINYSRGSQQTNRVRDYSFYPTEKALRPEQRHIKTQKNKIIHLQCKACQLPLSVMIVPVHVLNLANRISIKSEEERVGEKVSPIFSIWTAVLISTSGCQWYIL